MSAPDHACAMTDHENVVVACAVELIDSLQRGDVDMATLPQALEPLRRGVLAFKAARREYELAIMGSALADAQPLSMRERALAWLHGLYRSAWH